MVAPLTMQEWDHRMGPRLSKIERCAWWINHYVDEIEDCIKHMEMMPSFVTKAEFSLHEAAIKLRRAQSALLNLPREEGNNGKS